jgi:branched-chain amino acid transport system permease protein
MVDVLTIGVSLGCVYALVAIGFTLIYATTGVVNFAQGAFVMLGGIVAAWAVDSLGWPLYWALPAGVLAAMLGGLVLAVAVIIPLWHRGAAQFITILGTLMFLVLSENAVLNLIGSQPMTLPSITGAFSVTLGGGRIIPSQTFWVIGSAVGLGVLLTLYLSRQRMGMAMRATSFDQTSSRLLGISPDRVAIVAIVLSALIGGIGGILIAPLQFTAYNIASAYSVKGFLAAIVGGLGNVKGAVLGGVLVGLFEATVSVYVSSYYLDLFVMGALVAILLVRPRGIFGEPNVA